MAFSQLYLFRVNKYFSFPVWISFNIYGSWTRRCYVFSLLGLITEHQKMVFLAVLEVITNPFFSRQTFEKSLDRSRDNCTQYSRC